MDRLPVIVGVDGSPDSERAMHWAAEAARLRSAPLQVVHVWPYVTSARAAEAEAGTGDPVLEELRTKLPEGAELPEVEFRSLSGLTDVILPGLGDQAQLLVLGSRGRGGFASLLLGSNGMACAAHATCPVVVVPRPDRGGARQETAEGQEPGAAHGRIVLGVDPTAEDAGESEAIGFAFQEAARRGAVLQVVAAYMWPMAVPAAFDYVVAYDTTQREYEGALVRQVTEVLTRYRERYPDVAVEAELRPADAAGQLVEESARSDLVVVGRHRRRLPIGRRLGAVAHAVLLHALCPVAVVPEAVREEPEKTAD
ncbi:universal stress protein [Streptomyces sp. Ru73]|uniref:universal stress protein n=1 Tax=Streptomyces sp. Ru73 TaxID=2080748 RepID=UPI000CDE2BCF|nr:universal stress protein [Streptomyces sp. Ru73]POX36143.1 universal stress protein [Streptomyces sp. Ru73]